MNSLGQRRAVDLDLDSDVDGLGVVSSDVVWNYTDRGEVRAIWGDQTYPRRYQYDAQGRMTHLHTYTSTPTGEPTANGDSITSWVYSSTRGWLVEKNYHDETEDGITDADYTYTAAGRLATRTWQRGVVTTYGYTYGFLTNVTYTSDPANTPNLVYTYDSFGRMTKVTAGGANHFDYTYDPDTFQLETEKGYLGFSYRLLTRKYDDFLRPTGQTLGTHGSPGSIHETTYTYDDAGLLLTAAYQQAGGAVKTFAYDYYGGSGGLIKTVTGPTHEVTKVWDTTRNVLDVIRNHNLADTSDFSKYDYFANDLGQRDNVARSGTAFASSATVQWDYNSHGEVVAEDHPTAARDNAYAYDSIGNWQESVTGSLTLPGVNYTTNPLNQYTATPSDRRAASWRLCSRCPRSSRCR